MRIGPDHTQRWQMFGLETVFPAAHVCLRLELAALGNWPHKAPATTDPTRVATAMLKVHPHSFWLGNVQKMALLIHNMCSMLSLY